MLSLLNMLFGSSELSQAEIYDLVHKKNALLIDVRSEGEYAKGHVRNSLNIPLDQLDEKSEELDKKRPVIIYCASGARSSVALKILQTNGFDVVYNAHRWEHVSAALDRGHK